MFSLKALWEAVSRLTGAINRFAGTLEEADARAREQLHLDRPPTLQVTATSGGNAEREPDEDDEDDDSGNTKHRNGNGRKAKVSR